MDRRRVKVNREFLINKMHFYSFVFFYFLLSIATCYSSQTFSVKRTIIDDTVRKDPVTAITKLIRFSEGNLKNETPYNGKAFGYKKGESFYIRDIPPNENFLIETSDYDSIQFYFEWDEGVISKFFLKVLDNQPFEYKTSPIMEMSGADLIVANNQMKDLFLKENGAGKKLYSVTITDDVNPDLVKVDPLPEASLYIEVVKLDSSTYHVKIKDKTIFLGNLSEDIKNKWSKGEEIKFPIGIIMTDTIVPEHTVPINYTLVKKKKPKKIKN